MSTAHGNGFARTAGSVLLPIAAFQESHTWVRSTTDRSTQDTLPKGNQAPRLGCRHGGRHQPRSVTIMPAMG